VKLTLTTTKTTERIKMPVRRYKGDKAKADKLFSEIVRSLGYCEAEGYDDRHCSNQLQTAHIITRKRSATRTNLRNAYALCFAHHRYFTDYPRQFSRFITGTWAQEYYDELYQESIIATKIDWGERVAYLTEVKRRIDSGEITLSDARKL
jgi:hypothetical protein